MVLDIESIRKAVATRMWLEHPFLANMMFRLGVNYIRDEEEDGWAWNDGLTTYINISALEKDEMLKDTLTLDNIIFLVGHELLHTINMTNQREHGRNHKIWNYATDYEINDILINNETNRKVKGVGQMPRSELNKNPLNPQGLIGCYNSKYKGWSAERIYDDLLEQSKNQPQSGQGDGEGESVDLGGMGDGEGKGNNKNTSPDGSGQRLLDNHDKGQGMSQADVNRLKAEISQTIKSMESSGQSCGKGSSTIFDRMSEWIFKEPQFDWKGCLTHYLKSWIKDDYTWKRPGRRSQGAGVYLPSHLNIATIKIALAIDTSGSVGDKELQDFMSHINSILKCFKKFDLDVWCFSGEVHKDTLCHYNQTNSDIRCQLVQSTGSTDIKSNFSYLEESKEKYDVFIILTDGYDSIKNIKFDKCPTIWGIIDNKDFKSPVGVMKSIVVPIEFD